MSKKTETSRWWSVPQAIVWIVTGDAVQVADATDVQFLPGIWRLSLPRFFSIGDEPPISTARAPDVLLSAIWRGTVEVFGRYGGEGNPRRVSLGNMIGVKWKDQDGGICIVEDFGSGPADFWSDLAMRPTECMRRWPAPADQVQRDDTPKHPPRRRGRKPAQLNAAREYLQTKYGQHVPESIKLENLRDELKDAKILVTLRTLGRALGRE